MRSVILAQERLTQNALTVGVNCVNRTRKHVASVTAYSVLLLVLPFGAALQSCISRPQASSGAKRSLKSELPSDVQGFFQSVRVISHPEFPAIALGCVYGEASVRAYQETSGRNSRDQ